MLRSTFFSLGLFVFLCGVSFLFVDQVVLTVQESPAREQGFRGLFNSLQPRGPRTFDPPDWGAFSLMSIGAVTMLYSIALPKKQG